MNDLLKFITCGSVDDGKSTLIGHMLYDAKLLFVDQEASLKLDSKIGSRGGEIDYSLLLDGLIAEREQGITIDVAYRYFTTERRSFIVADTPGHEEYTRNMAVGASFADLAIILVDVTQGILLQTRRHARICALMGIRHFVFALNKMDLVDYSESEYKKVSKEIKKLSIDLDLEFVNIIPLSATEGDNITKKSTNMTWYTDETLLSFLENVNVNDAKDEKGFVMPIQRVCRPNSMFRGFEGQVESGTIRVGETIQVLPSGEEAKVISILVAAKDVNNATTGQPVTIQLDREIDISRGDVIVRDTEVHVANMYNSTILWMDDEPLVEGRSYLLKVGTKKIPATVMQIKHKIDINTGDLVPTHTLHKNEIAECNIAISEKIVFDQFNKHKAIGNFILINRISNATSACGIINHSLRRSDNLSWQSLDITREIRAKNLGQKPKTLWFTGLSGSGKSTLANEIEKALTIKGMHTMLLDGDNVRMGLNKNLGFTEKDRIENIRRVAEVAKLMNDAGLIVLTSFISPFEVDRERAREIIGNSFIEIYVSTPLEICEKRDVKGLYKKARNGEIPNFTGISSIFDVPQRAEIVIDTSNHSIEESTEIILKELEKYL